MNTGACACGRGKADRFLSSDYAWGGNSAMGSFRRAGCAECEKEVRAALAARGYSLKVEPLSV